MQKMANVHKCNTNKIYGFFYGKYNDQLLNINCDTGIISNIKLLLKEMDQEQIPIEWTLRLISKRFVYEIHKRTAF